MFVDKSLVDPRRVRQRLGGDPERVRDLARKAGLDPDILEKWVAGKIRLSAGDQQRVAKALGL